MLKNPRLAASLVSRCSWSPYSRSSFAALAQACSGIDNSLLLEGRASSGSQASTSAPAVHHSSRLWACGSAHAPSATATTAPGQPSLSSPHAGLHAALLGGAGPRAPRQADGRRLPLGRQHCNNCTHLCLHPLWHQQRRQLAVDTRGPAPQPTRLRLPTRDSHAGSPLPDRGDQEALQDATELIRRLQGAGQLAYIAGGWVRDHFFGLSPADIDIATSASVPEVQRLFGPAFVERLHPNTARVRQGLGHAFEVTTFKGSKRQLDTDGWPPYFDAVYRDFTINSLLYDPVSGEVLDYVGAVEDIKNKILRMNRSEFRRGWSVLHEDPVRVLRGVRLAVQFDLQPEAATLATMRQCTSLCVMDAGKPLSLRLRLDTGVGTVRCSTVRPARVWRELQKIAALERDKPEAISTALRLCQEVHLLPKLFPFLAKSALAAKAWEVQKLMPASLPLELRILGLVNPFTDASGLHAATDMLRRLSDALPDGLQPNLEAVRLYTDFVAGVARLYTDGRGPGAIRERTAAVARMLTCEGSQHCVGVAAEWLDDMDVQCSAPAPSQPPAVGSPTGGGDGSQGAGAGGALTVRTHGYKTRFLRDMQELRMQRQLGGAGGLALGARVQAQTT